MQQKQISSKKGQPPPPPPIPSKQKSTPSARRSFKQKYVPLMFSNNCDQGEASNNQMQQEAQTQPPNSPKRLQESKIAFVKKLSLQTHQDSKTSTNNTMVTNVNSNAQQQSQNISSNNLQSVVLMLQKAQNQNSKLELALKQSQMREQIVAQKLEAQQGESRAMKEKVRSLKDQLMKFQAKILKVEEQNNRINQGLLQQSGITSEIDRLKNQNAQLKEVLSGQNSLVSSQNIELENQLRDMYRLDQENYNQNYNSSQAAQRLKSKVIKLQRDNKQKDNYIRHLKQKLDEKKNQILTPKSSRERTPQNKSRQNWNQLGNNNNNLELIDFDDQNQDKMRLDLISRRIDDLSHTEQHHNNIQRLVAGSRIIYNNNNNNNSEQESKTPPTYHHHNDLRQQLFNNVSNEIIFPNSVGESGMIPSFEDTNISRLQNHQQFDILGNNSLQNRLSIRVQGNGQLEPGSTFGVSHNLNEVLWRNDINQQGNVTPRTNQPERKSRRGSRASTPTKQQADTPTKSSAPLQQQMIHNLANGQTISFSQVPAPPPPAAQIDEFNEEDNVQLCPNDLFS